MDRDKLVTDAELAATDAELFRAKMAARDRYLAQMLAWLTEVAAEHHPEELRAALGKCLDLSVWETQNKQLIMIYSSIQERLARTLSTLSHLEKDVERIREEIDHLRQKGKR